MRVLVGGGDGAWCCSYVYSFGLVSPFFFGLVWFGLVVRGDTTGNKNWTGSAARGMAWLAFSVGFLFER